MSIAVEGTIQKKFAWYPLATIEGRIWLRWFWERRDYDVAGRVVLIVRSKSRNPRFPNEPLS